jgi:hypothetical protein
MNLLDLYPSKFTSGLSQLRLKKPDGLEIVAYMSLNPVNYSLMNLSIDTDTVPANTILSDYSNTYRRGTIDAIINPQTFNPNSQAGQGIDKRYLILEDIVLNDLTNGPSAWSSITTVSGEPNGITAQANDIIQWDGNQWRILFNAAATTTTTYITNAYTGIQYKWDGTQWSKSFEGVYANTDWRMIL